MIKIPCEIYSRVVGYLRPVSSWNVGKRRELAERKDYVIEKEGIGGSNDELDDDELVGS